MDENEVLVESARPTNFQINVSVLGFEEEGRWCAMALEMSLCGYGDTYEEAVKDLKAAMTAQIEFTLSQGDMDQLLFPAEPDYFEQYNDAKKEALRQALGEALLNWTAAVNSLSSIAYDYRPRFVLPGRSQFQEA